LSPFVLLSLLAKFQFQSHSDPTTQTNSRLNHAIKSLLGAMNPNNPDLSQGTVDCCICLNSMAPFQALFLAPCSHCFHYKCVTPLLAQGFMFMCPMCRQVANLEATVATDEVSASSGDEEMGGSEDEAEALSPVTGGVTCI
jgi:RING-like zinc finger